QKYTFDADIRFRAALHAEREDRRHDGDVADVEPVVHVCPAAELAIAHADDVAARLGKLVTEKAVVALDQDSALQIGELQRRLNLGANRAGQNLHAELLAWLHVDAIEIDVARFVQ